MLDKITAELTKTYTKTDTRGIFFSIFDAQNTLLCSQGSIITDKNVFDLAEILYHSILANYEKQAKTLIIDIVIEIQPQPDLTKLLTLSPTQRGIFAINKENNASGVVLPNTQGVTDIKIALTLLKQKYNLSGNVEISSFKTRRITINL